MKKQKNNVTELTVRFYREYTPIRYVTIRLSKKGVSVRFGGKRLGLTIGGGGVYISGTLLGIGGVGFRRKLSLGKAEKVN